MCILIQKCACKLVLFKLRSWNLNFKMETQWMPSEWKKKTVQWVHVALEKMRAFRNTSFCLIWEVFFLISLERACSRNISLFPCRRDRSHSRSILAADLILAPTSEQKITRRVRGNEEITHLARGNARLSLHGSKRNDDAFATMHKNHLCRYVFLSPPYHPLSLCLPLTFSPYSNYIRQPCIFVAVDNDVFSSGACTVCSRVSNSRKLCIVICDTNSCT